MPPEPNKELSRKFRLLGQMISMHSILRVRYERRSLAVDVVLLGCAVVFCATTFVRPERFSEFGLSPDFVQLSLGIASVLAFFASLVGMLLDWKGKSARHADAHRELSRAYAQFRDQRDPDGNWPPRKKAELERQYWTAMENIVAIPDHLFPSLKAKHLRKIAVSRWLDKHPGCPVWLLQFLLVIRSVPKAWIPTTQYEEIARERVKEDAEQAAETPDQQTSKHAADGSGGRLPDGKGNGH